MRRAAVVVLAALVVAGCGGEPLRRGFADDEPTTVSTSPSPSGQFRAEIRVNTTQAEPARDPLRHALPKAALVADGLEVQESSGEFDAKMLNLCGAETGASGEARKQRIVTRSTSGASRLEQEIAVYGTAISPPKPACAGAEKMTLPAAQLGWCEPRAGGRAVCNIVVWGQDHVVQLKLETISAQRARDVITRLAAAIPAK